MTLLELLDLMKKRIKLVIGLPIVCALLIGVYTFMFMPDTYTATTSMYVLTNQDQSAGNLSTDLSASQMVAKVANSIAENVAAISQDVMKVEAVNIIDAALAPVAPSGPSRPLYVAVAFMGHNGKWRG